MSGSGGSGRRLRERTEKEEEKGRGRRRGRRTVMDSVLSELSQALRNVNVVESSYAPISAYHKKLDRSAPLQTTPSL